MVTIVMPLLHVNPLFLVQVHHLLVAQAQHHLLVAQVLVVVHIVLIIDLNVVMENLQIVHNHLMYCFVQAQNFNAVIHKQENVELIKVFLIQLVD